MRKYNKSQGLSKEQSQRVEGGGACLIKRIKRKSHHERGSRLLVNLEIGNLPTLQAHSGTLLEHGSCQLT